MATFLHPILSASHLCSWNSRWENTIDRKLYEYKPIWPDLFQWTRYFLQENLWYFPLASHRCMWHLSCDHLGLFFPLGKKHTSLPCLSCKLIHTMYFGAVFGWFNICSFFPSALSLNLQKKYGTLLKTGVATSSWMPLMISTVLIIPCQQLFASPIFLEFKYMLLLDT